MEWFDHKWLEYNYIHVNRHQNQKRQITDIKTKLAFIPYIRSSLYQIEKYTARKEKP